MVARDASASPFEIDVAPALKVYMDGLATWKESCERLLQPAAVNPAANQAGPAIPAGPPAHAWPYPGGAWAEQAAQQQAELLRFYGRRVACYVELSDRVSRCRTPVEFGEAQLEFLRQTVADYSRQGARLAEAAAPSRRQA
jgi:hypothetical protein